MGANSKIEWTNHTFNFWRGCVEATLPDGTPNPCCDHCYAKAMAKRNPRLLGAWGTPDQGGTRILAAREYWDLPFKWNAAARLAGQRQRVFCQSLSDVFEDWRGEVLSHNGKLIKVCDDCGKLGESSLACPNCHRQATAPNATLGDLRRVLFTEIVDKTPWLDWLVLSKRPGNVPTMLPPIAGRGPLHQHFRPNLLLGTSIGTQAGCALIDELLELRDLAAGLFLSIEPLLEPVDLGLRNWNGLGKNGGKIDWVIVGGESGHHARPMHPDWVRVIRDDCQAAGVPFFFKQWGEWAPFSDVDDLFETTLGNDVPVCLVKKDGRVIRPYCYNDRPGQQMAKVGKAEAGRLLDNREWSEFPNFHEVTHV